MVWFDFQVVCWVNMLTLLATSSAFSYSQTSIYWGGALKEFKNLFELKFFSKDVHPETIFMRDLAEVLKDLEAGLLSIAHKESPDILKEGFGASLVDISEGCAALKIAPIGEPVMKPALEVYTTSIANNRVGKLPAEAQKSVRTIEAFSVRYKCESQFRLNPNDKNPTAVILPPKEIPIELDTEVKGETDVYGIVERVGGATKPKAFLRLPDGKGLSMLINKELARELGQWIYSWVCLTGEAEWNEKTNELVSFKVKEVSEYAHRPVDQVMKELSEEFGKFFEDIDDVDGFVSELREE